MVVWDARPLRGVPRGPLTVSDRPFQLERPHTPCREAVQERVVRQIRMLRARRRELETGLRRLLHGHAGGNPGHSQGAAYGLPRQFPTLPGAPREPKHRGVEPDWQRRLTLECALGWILWAYERLLLQ